MTTTTRLVRAALAALVPLAAPTLALAQGAAHAPPPELQKLEPFAGNWSGSGTMDEPGGASTKWTAMGSYRWVLGNRWLQEDFTIRFEGIEQPLAFRGWVGWDGERRTYVKVAANNGGEAQLSDFVILPDGTQVTTEVRHQQGMPYAQRSRLKVDGDRMTHTLDMLMADGASTTIVRGAFERNDAEAPSALATTNTWMAAVPHAEMRKLARIAGRYRVEGTMTAMPGQPPMKIRGVDAFVPVFGGTVLHARTDGEAEGMPGKYEAEALWAYDAQKQSLVAVFVSNMGEVGRTEARFTDDGKALVGTSAAPMSGQLAAMRGVLSLDAEGRPTAYAAHLLAGAAPPLEHFQATYGRQ